MPGSETGRGDARERADLETSPATGVGEDADRQAADRGETVGRLLVQACVECGREYMFEAEPPEDLICDRCGNGVFRAFYDDSRPGDAEREFTEETDRDLGADAGASEVEPGDLYDLNNP
ncbi:MAG: hypothetical protein ACRELV_08480 [Longimicrobiales bacterium]